MTVTVITRREVGWFGFELGLNTEYSFWEQVLLSYAVDRFIMIPTTEDANNPESYADLDEALEMVTGTRIFLERAQRAVDIGREPLYLRDFEHPQDAVYILGSSLAHNLQWIGEEDILLTVGQLDPIGSMFGMTMLSVVLHDRMVKQAAAIRMLKALLGFNAVVEYTYTGDDNTGAILYFYDTAENANTHDKSTGLIQTLTMTSTFSGGKPTIARTTE